MRKTANRLTTRLKTKLIHTQYLPGDHVEETVSRLYAIVSGEHPTLPFAEIESILAAHSIAPTGSIKHFKLAKFEAPTHALNLVTERSLMCEETGVEIAAGTLETPRSANILESIRGSSFERHLTGDRSFCVRVVKLSGGAPPSPELERTVGSVISRRLNREARVDLEHASNVFTLVVYSGGWLLGKRYTTRPPRAVVARRARARPRFHPSTMQPKLARCMVNLSRPPPSGIFLDPFCGVGGIALEAATIGLRTIASDLNSRMARSTRTNLCFFGADYESILVADAMRLPLVEVDSIAADPPYGRGASTMGSNLKQILTDFLPQAAQALRRDGRVCLAVPHTLDLDEIALSTNFMIAESHLIRVHRSLTRRIVVLEKR